MYTCDALSQLHNFTDTPDEKHVIPLNFLQHFTPNYMEHSYSHLVENLYAHKKPKPETPISKTRTTTAAKTLTTRPQQHPRS